MENHFMDPAIVTLRGKKEEDKVELATHEGQEFMYVLEGKVEVDSWVKTIRSKARGCSLLERERSA